MENSSETFFFVCFTEPTFFLTWANPKEDD